MPAREGPSRLQDVGLAGERWCLHALGTAKQARPVRSRIEARPGRRSRESRFTIDEAKQVLCYGIAVH